MKIAFLNFDLLKEHEKKTIKEAICRAIKPAGLRGYSLTIKLASDDEMLSLQKQFKNKNALTDVLSFPLPEVEKSFEHSKKMLGDIVICLSSAKAQAKEFSHSLLEEMVVLAVHGLFHLLGYDHEISPEESEIQMQAEMSLLDMAEFRPELCLIGRKL